MLGVESARFSGTSVRPSEGPLPPLRPVIGMNEAPREPEIPVASREAPRWAFVGAFAVGALGLGSVLAAAAVGVAGNPALWLSCGIAAALSALLASRWPIPSWRWGVWVSGPFWMFFLFVFAVLALDGNLDWTPALDAAIVAGGACIAAAVGARARRAIVAANTSGSGGRATRRARHGP